MGAAVYFGHARQLAGRGLAVAERGVRNVVQAAREAVDYNRQPLPDIPIDKFTPGTVSAGAFTAKLGTAIWNAARQRSRLARQEELLQETRRRTALQIQRLEQQVNEPRYSYGNVSGLTPGQAATLEAGDRPRPRAAVKLATDRYGFKAGDEVDPAELAQAGQDARSGAREARLARGRAAGSAISALNSEKNSLEERTNPNGSFSLQAQTVAHGAANRLREMAMSDDAGARRKAAFALGIPMRKYNAGVPSDLEMLDKATAGWVNAFWRRKMSEEAKRVAPRRVAVENAIRREGRLISDVGSGMSDEEAQFLRSIDEVLEE